MDKDVIVGDKVYVVENVGLFHFGILTSNVYNAWMRAVCGRLKSDSGRPRKIFRIKSCGLIR